MSNPAIDEGMPQWQRDILEEYLASVQKSRASGHDADSDEDDAMSTDSESFFSEPSTSALSSTFSAIALHDRASARDDIASDDSAFSSEDEFADDEVREQQRLRRELMLGRPSAVVLALSHRALKNMHEAYMQQLNDADIELAELKGTELHPIAQREPVVEYIQPVALRGPDATAIVTELRKRSSKEICDLDKPDLVQGLVLLAQALFRKEREIKRIVYGQEPEEMVDDDDEE